MDSAPNPGAASAVDVLGSAVGQRAQAASSNVATATARQPDARHLTTRGVRDVLSLSMIRPSPRDARGQSSISRSNATPPSCGAAITFWYTRPGKILSVLPTWLLREYR